jgi:hypothetical protein
MTERALLLHEVPSKVFLGGERIVRPATQREIRRLVLATTSKRLQVM